MLSKENKKSSLNTGSKKGSKRKKQRSGGGGTAVTAARQQEDKLRDTLDNFESTVRDHQAGFAEAQSEFTRLISALKDGETLKLSIEFTSKIQL